ncbi:MAG: ABC transporter ATP-binding protein [Candidatus Pacearchaeota archaeon]
MKKSKKEDLDVRYILKTYWSFIKKYKLLITSILLCGVFFSTAGLAQRTLFKKIVDNGELFAKGEISSTNLYEIIIVVIFVWLAVIGLRAIFRWLRVHWINKLEANSVLNLKQYYYNHIVSLDYKFHTTHKTGSLIARLSRGSSAMERLTDFASYQTMAIIFEVLIAGGALMLVDKSIGLIILATGIIFITYSYKLQKKQRTLKLIANTTEDIEKGFTGDTMTNIESIKYYGKENMIRSKYSSLTEKTKNAWFKEWQLGRWSSSIETLIVDIGGLISLGIILRSFLQGNTTLGTVVFVWTSYWQIISSVQNFMDGLRGYNKSIADFHDLFQYGKINNRIKDKESADNLQVKEGLIEFENISFKYHNNDFFKNFNLIVPKGEKIALVGHSGSGKSTLVKLLYRLYDLNSGKIKIDGIDIKDVKQESLRSELSIVPQECVLFDDTIYNNILFSNPKASRQEVFQAIKFAQLDKTIGNFPNKENTIVGERGVKLSGGEKQRVSIARALLADKKILVLDEATSALDSKTEHEIQKDLQNLMQGRTSIIIAHRLSTIMSADLIVVLKDGKIVQKGTHRQLINQRGEYKELWNLQKGGYISD